MALPSMIRAAGALAAPLVVSVMNRYSRVSLVVNALTGHRLAVGGTSIRAHLTTSSPLAEARQRWLLGRRIDTLPRYARER
jgi:hypothetical protein